MNPMPVEDQVDGYEAQLVGDHQGGEDDEEQHLAPREPQPREGVARDAPEDEVGHRHRGAMRPLLKNSRGSGGSSW